jgi:hypothetical protein
MNANLKTPEIENGLTVISPAFNCKGILSDSILETCRVCGALN